MPTALSFAGLLVLGCLALVVFVLGRGSVAAALGAGDRLPPFGEPRLAGLGRVGLLGRAVIALAGVIAVYTFITGLFVLALSQGGEAPAGGPPVVDVVPGLPAHAAGMRDGDRLVGLDGLRLTSFEQLRTRVAARPLEPVAVEVERDEKVLRLQIQPEGGRIGVRARLQAGSRGEAVRRGVWMPLRTWASFARTAVGRDEPATLSGPVGIIRSAGPGGIGQALMAVAVNLSWDLANVLVASLALLFAVPWRGAAPPVSAQASLGPGRPVLRWLARLIDGVLILGATSLLEGLIGLSAGLLAVLLAIPVEALLLATWGYTPGKWLMGVVVRSARGGKLSLGEALHRAGAVSIFGLGAGLAYGLIPGLMAKGRLERTGSTYWDDLGGFQVEHETVGGLQVAGLMFLCLGAVATFFWRSTRHMWGW